MQPRLHILTRLFTLRFLLTFFFLKQHDQIFFVNLNMEDFDFNLKTNFRIENKRVVLFYIFCAILVQLFNYLSFPLKYWNAILIPFSALMPWRRKVQVKYYRENNILKGTRLRIEIFYIIHDIEMDTWFWLCFYTLSGRGYDTLSGRGNETCWGRILQMWWEIKIINNARFTIATEQCVK